MLCYTFTGTIPYGRAVIFFFFNFNRYIFFNFCIFISLGINL